MSSYRLATIFAAVGICFVQTSALAQTGAVTPSAGKLDEQAVAVLGDFTSDSKSIKQKPYLADIEVETTVLVDGALTTHKSTGSVARDSEGCIRRTLSSADTDPGSTKSDGDDAMFIKDKSGMTLGYGPMPRQGEIVVAQGQQDAPPSSAPSMESLASMPRQSGVGRAPRREAGSPPPPDPSRASLYRMMNPSKPDPKQHVEDLGTLTLEGVEARGTRTTRTVPPKATGDYNPIEVTIERWYSPELKAVVMSKWSDSRGEEITLRLTKIQQVEPSSSLTDVPQGQYVVNDVGRVQR